MAATVRTAEFPFTLERSDETSDGLTFEGFVAVYDSPVPISDQFGEYTETIARSAFTRTLQRGYPPLLFEHGKHPLIGRMPLGVITKMEPVARGLFVQARLSDNWLIQPVRDAIRDKAITGCSVRMEPVKVDDTGRGASRTRVIREAKLYDVGPVVYPAYKETTAAIRSAFGALDAAEGMSGLVRVQLLDRDTEISTQDSSVAALVSDAVETLWGLSDEQSDAYIIDFFADRAVFAVVGAATSRHPGLWQVTYTYTDGAVTISTPTRVDVTAPRSRSKNGAKMTARSDVTFADITEAVEDAIETLIGSDDVDSDVWVCDISDTWAVFSVWGSLEDQWPDYWKVDYTLDADGVATIGTPVHVEEVYVPTAVPPQRCVDLKGTTRNKSTSKELASRTSEELADTPIRGMTRDKAIQRIALQERGIALPKEYEDAR